MNNKTKKKAEMGNEDDVLLRRVRWTMGFYGC